MTIKQHCIFHSIWIKHYRNYGSQTNILIKLVLTEYNDNLKNWDINCMNQVEKTYGKIFKSTQYQKQKLLDIIPGLSILSSQRASSQVAYLSQNTSAAEEVTLLNEPAIK